MRLFKARVQNYRSILDTGEFEIENLKTILVGPNEAGKTVILQALQQINKPDEVDGFDSLRDYPRSQYNDVKTGKVKLEDVTVVTGYFELEQDDKDVLPEEFKNCVYKCSRNIDNKAYHSLINAPEKIQYKDINKDLARLTDHLDKQYSSANPEEETNKPSVAINNLIESWSDYYILSVENCEKLKKILEDNYTLIDEDNDKEEARLC